MHQHATQEPWSSHRTGSIEGVGHPSGRQHRSPTGSDHPPTGGPGIPQAKHNLQLNKLIGNMTLTIQGGGKYKGGDFFMCTG